MLHFRDLDGLLIKDIWRARQASAGLIGVDLEEIKSDIYSGGMGFTTIFPLCEVILYILYIMLKTNEITGMM